MKRKFASFCYLVNCSNMLFWATVCKTVRDMLLDRCLSVCRVCDIGVLWPNGWMDQHATWYGGRPPPWPPCVRWGPSSPKGAQQPPIFDPCLFWPNGWMDQDAAWYGGRPRRLGPGHIVLGGDWGPSSSDRKGHSSPPTFQRVSKFVMQWSWLLRHS